MKCDLKAKVYCSKFDEKKCRNVKAAKFDTPYKAI